MLESKQVEIWSSTIQRDVISRGVFTSVRDRARKLMRYIRNYNKTATPIRWIYKNAAHSSELPKAGIATFSDFSSENSHWRCDNRIVERDIYWYPRSGY
jgi:hypothetical protein